MVSRDGSGGGTLPRYGGWYVRLSRVLTSGTVGVPRVRGGRDMVGSSSKMKEGGGGRRGWRV